MKVESKTFEDVKYCQRGKRWDDFFISRVVDPTSYFYKYHYQEQIHEKKIVRVKIYLVDIDWLKPHEEILSNERVAGLRRATINWGAYTEPLLVDSNTGTILDGHHRYRVGLQLQLRRLPVVLVDYLKDSSITVDIWPSAKMDALSKQDVVNMGLSNKLMPPKTSRHRFADALPPISIDLGILRKENVVKNIGVLQNSSASSNDHLLSDFSKQLILGAPVATFQALRGVFRNRIRTVSKRLSNGNTDLDVVTRRRVDVNERFNLLRLNDPTSSFCTLKALTLEDLVQAGIPKNRHFFTSRITDPTSYFYKYRLDNAHERAPHRQQVDLVDIHWLKAHEEVVSWERVEGLKRATIKWDAYTEPLLVDRTTGSILDGHHRYNVGLLLKLDYLPVVQVDYLEDDSIKVDVWPDCGLDSLTKEQVIDMSLSDSVFPPKTSRHEFSDNLPPISIALTKLKK